MSARPPGITGSRASARRRRAGRRADVADRLLLAAAVGAGDPGDRDGDVGIEALQRPVGHRLGDLGRDRAVALDQLRVDAEQVDFAWFE